MELTSTAASTGTAAGTTDAIAVPAAGLDEVRVRRAELRGSLHVLEICLSAPAVGRPVAWGEDVHDALVTLAGDFAAHVEITEGPGGLHQAILAGDVRLANAVEALGVEHRDMAAAIARLVADSAAPVTDEETEPLRERATALLGVLLRHRQRGADLVWEAYETDLGGGD